MKVNINVFIVLLIIKSIPNYSNSYDLIRILERNFKFFDPRNFIKEAVFLNLIEENISINSIYKITRLGNKVYQQNIEEYSYKLLETYPEERQFIELLISSANKVH